MVLLIVLFLLVLIWEFSYSQLLALTQTLRYRYETFKTINLPQQFAIGMKDEQIPLSRKPRLAFSTLKPSMEFLSPDNMSILFEVTLTENYIPEQDLISFETLTHYHRISLMKDGRERKMKIATDAFVQNSNCTTNHCESVRLYEFKTFVDKSKEPMVTESFKIKKRFDPITKQYALVYDRDHVTVWENGIAERNQFTPIKQDNPISNVIDFKTQDVVIFIGSSDVEDDGGYLVKNFVLYNGALSEEELNSLAVSQ